MNPIKILGVLLFLSSVMACGRDFQIGHTPQPVTDTDQLPDIANHIREKLISMLQDIKENGMNINEAYGLYNLTALHLATLLGDREMVELLLALGADPTKTDKDGRTPLEFAEQQGNSALIDILSKTDVGQKDSKDKTADTSNVKKKRNVAIDDFIRELLMSRLEVIEKDNTHLIIVVKRVT